MKRNIAALIICLSIAVLSACDYLDRAPEAEGYSMEDIFGDSTKYNGYVQYLITNPVFLYLEAGTAPQGSWDCGVSDNSISSALFTNIPSVIAVKGDYLSMKTGTAANNALMCCDGTWDQFWRHIRVANNGIRNIHMFNGSDESRDRILGLCYFYRGWCYMELCRRWGGMPYLFAPLKADAQVDIPRLSMQETYIQAAIDCDSAAMFLKNTLPATEFPSPHRVAALAIKSRILLYAASDQARKISPDPKDLWVEAAMAADECLKAAEDNGYELTPWNKYKNMFADIDEEYYLKECLYARRQNHGWSANAYLNNCGRPPGQLGGNYGTCPNAALVESFEMKNGLLPEDNGSGYNAQDPWSNKNAIKRDNRLTFNIAYNGLTVLTKTLQIYNYDEATGTRSALDLDYGGGAAPKQGFTLTGTYATKFWGTNWNAATNVLWSYIRLAEVYLNFAEAANEAWGNPGSKNSGCRYSAEEAINKVRVRAEQPPILPQFLNKSNFQYRVRNERRVELCFEEHRVFDVRRWQIGTTEKYKNIYGYYITKLASGYNATTYPTGYKYDRVLVRDRVFEERHYLYPIKLNDTRLGPEFNQNPGW